jgi:GNAT superfamily N-acetyltransferase
MVQLVRVTEELPDGFAALAAEAEAEGHRHIRRLAEEWASGAQRFDDPGEALLATFAQGELAGVGGLTVEPSESGEPALRMRRLYVAVAARGRGVGRTIANALLQEAGDQVDLITVHAGNEGAAAFWEALGFRPTSGRAWSHEFRRSLGH